MPIPGQNVKDLWESEVRLHGENATQSFTDKCGKLIQDGDLRYEDFSIKEVFESVSRTAFPTITGELILKPAMIDAYKAVPAIGNQLVTKYPSKRKQENIPGLTAIEFPEEVKESQRYPHTGVDEKYVLVKNHKYGRIIDVTEEAVMEDATGQLLMRIRNIGDAAARFREKVILYTIQDNASYYAYYPAGTRTALYQRTGAYYSLYETNTLAEWTDVDNARGYLALHTDDNGEPILVSANTLLVPEKLATTAAYIVTNTKDTRGTYNADAPPTNYKSLSSAFLDALSTSDWYFGDFKKQFALTDVWPLQVMQQKADASDDAFDRDIYAKFKVRMYFGCGARDYRYVCKST